MAGKSSPSTSKNKKLQEQSVFPIHEAIDYIKTNILLQIEGADVAYPLLAGDPGGGKTESLRAMANEMDWEFQSTHFALKLIEELAGLPSFSTSYRNGTKVEAVQWTIPEMVSKLDKLSDIAYTKEFGGFYVINNISGDIVRAVHNVREDAIVYDDETEHLEKVEGDGMQRGVLWLLDDLHLCSAQHNSMLMELLTERKIRDYKIPKNVAIVAAGNTTQKAGAKAQYSAVVNRMATIPVITSFKFWKEHYAIPKSIHPVVVSFLSNEAYTKQFHGEEQIDMPWPSPRSWTRFANFLSAIERNKNTQNIDSVDVSRLCESHVGKEAASEFTAYYSIFREFNMDEIFNTKLASDNSSEIKEYFNSLDDINKYAFAYACVAEYFTKNIKERKAAEYNKKIIKILKLYKENGYQEHAMSILTDMVHTFVASKQRKSMREFIDYLTTVDKKLVPSAVSKIIEYQK